VCILTEHKKKNPATGGDSKKERGSGRLSSDYSKKLRRSSTKKQLQSVEEKIGIFREKGL